MYLGKSGCILEKVVVFEQSGVIWTKLWYFLKVVLLGQNWFYWRKISFNRAKVVFSGKMVPFEKNSLYSGKIFQYSGKVVVFRQNWFHSGNVVVLRQK